MNTNVPQRQPEHPEARDVQTAPEALDTSKDIRVAIQRRLEDAGTLRMDMLKKAIRADAMTVLEAISADPKNADVVITQANAALKERYGEKGALPVIRLESAQNGLTAVIDDTLRLPIERKG